MAPGENVHLPSQHQNKEAKQSGFKSFLHRRQASDGTILPSPPLQDHRPQYHPSASDTDIIMAKSAQNNSGALCELQYNQQEAAGRSPRKPKDDHRGDGAGRSRSPMKSVLGNLSMKPSAEKDASKVAKSRDASPKKPKKTKSGTNLANLLSRPKSLRNLYKMATDEDIQSFKDKENRTPEQSPTMSPPPIFAQFSTDASVRQQAGFSSGESSRQGSGGDYFTAAAGKERPKSFQVLPNPQHPVTTPQSPGKSQPFDNGSRHGSGGDGVQSQTQRGRIFGAFSSHARSKSTAATPTTEVAEQLLDPKDIDKHLEALLDRRNIPENQRYKMRNLTNTIKTEFIRQDWAEMQATRGDRPGTTDSINSADGRGGPSGGSGAEDDQPKRTRGRSFTFSRSKKDPSSPSKKQKGEGTLGRHFRSKSTESVAMERPSSSCSTHGTTLLSKIKPQQGPGDFVTYLRKVQKPQLVEVGKLHKLRLLLRNETVAWIEEFIQQGGMEEIVGLLKRIMEVEWREEHEDALLHENLLCLKALSTTARAMGYLHSVQAELFPKLVHMLFDPERKGPSEFTTRNIITSVLLTYIQSAAPAERTARASSVLRHLRDPEPKDDEQPLPFVLEMRRDRPYREWCKEVVSVTKEVFWIFLHNVNVVTLPTDKRNGTTEQSAPRQTGDDGPYSYMLRHFPSERPPVPAAPYVGGVEWDATNYLASHLDVMNAILACTASSADRNALRAELRISGLERCMGSSLRLCKEKFYGSVHIGLRTWVAAAAEDGWEVKDVRFGPPAETRASPKKAGGGQRKPVEDAPKLDIPRLDFGLGQEQAPQHDAWL